MIFKKKYLLLTILLITIIIQIVLYTNNKQRTSFRYFRWTFQEVSIGKLISISFFSGFFISSLLNTSVSSYKENTIENIEEVYEPLNDDEDIESNVEIPPQRDIREAQPTISVNYRVVKNREENNLKRDQNYSNNLNNDEDWDNDDDDW
tara:strand:+ start:105 stop:551 length:447 start_codon:yes stop_codon:yes gene_type:complete